jgi:transcription termination factor Rho
VAVGSEHAWLGRVRPAPSSHLFRGVRRAISVEGTSMTTPVRFSDSPQETISGLLDIRDKSAFLRSTYLPSSGDPRIPIAQVRHHALRPGDHVVASPDFATVHTVNGHPTWRSRPHFDTLTPIHPRTRIRLETASPTTRVIDLFAPIGKGQRGLIVAPPKAGKTMILQDIAAAITHNHPEVHLMVVLVGERPEEVTEMRESIRGDVAASTFDRSDRDRTTVAELAIERARRLVEHGTDVVLLLDSLTRLARAYNNLAPNGGRILAGGLDAAALLPPRRFFGAARNVREGGSLTILATALVENGSRMDDNLFEEFKGTGNMELRLSRALAEKRLFPAVDLEASSTRREEMLLGAGERRLVWRLRRTLGALGREQGMEVLMAKIRETSSNEVFLREVREVA